MRKHEAPHEVFKLFDMKGGSKEECWEWHRRMSPHPVTSLYGREVQVRRLVYSLKHGVHIDDVPRLIPRCRNTRCVNPFHCVPFAAVAGIVGSRKVRTYEEAIKQANFLPYTKRGKKRALTKQAKRSIREEQKKEKEVQ